MVVEFAVILAMQLGLAMAARRLSRKQRDDLKTEVLGQLEQKEEPAAFGPTAPSTSTRRLRAVERR
jgi:hypothetical protein